MFRSAQHDNALLTRRAVEQLELELHVIGQALRLPNSTTATGAIALQFPARDLDLESKARELLRGFGIDEVVRVEWNARLKSCAGRADFRNKLITLNPRLRELNHRYTEPKMSPNKLDGLKPSSLIIRDEIERTFRHELAHLLAQFRAGRKRISPHGAEWRAACLDLGIGDEKRTHNLPFPIRELPRRFLYRCPHCEKNFPRVRKIRRTLACLVCCRAHNGGDFDPRFRLKLIR